MTIEKLLGLFPDAYFRKDVAEADPRMERREYMARCPAHDDNGRSLLIRVKRRKQDRQIIGVCFSCMAGCDVKQILAMAGADVEELARDGVKTNADSVTAGAQAWKMSAMETGGQVIHAEQGLTVGQEAWQEIRETGKGVREIGTVIQRAIEAMASMAETVRVTNERMGAIEEEMRGLRETIRTLEKVTPEQAKTVNRLIRQRARDLCEEYRMGVSIDHRADGKGKPGVREWEPDPEGVKKLTAIIRTDVREMAGVRTAREIARCDWESVAGFILGWDDFEQIQRIRKSRKDQRAKGDGKAAETGEAGEKGRKGGAA